MAVLSVPPLDLSVPTLGPQVAQFIRDKCVFGPGSLADQPAVLDQEKLGLLYRAYEVYPMGHPFAGKRHFERVVFELRKGLAKTEFAAWIAYAELHPESPVRFDGFNPDGTLKQGRPVAYPFIPMLATTEEQVQELAYGVLKYVVEHSEDADLFDIGLERIVRLGPRGENDGEAKAVAGSPGPLDGARTTFQHFDEPHRIYLDRQRAAVETMLANMGKRAAEDPWTLYTSTAGKPGQKSVEEDVRMEAEKIEKGEIEKPSLFFFSRWAGQEHDDLSTVDKRIAAITDATGPMGEWGLGQFDRIARDYDREGMDRAYWEQVYLNRWRKAGSQMFDMTLVKELKRPHVVIPEGAWVAGGFDGARRQDSTAFVITEIDTGQQQLVGIWEKPEFDDDWEVEDQQVTDVFLDVRKRYELYKVFGDPPHWTETLATWATKFPDQVQEYWTNQYRRMALDIRAYNEAIQNGTVTFVGMEHQVEKMVDHLGNAGKKELNIVDDKGVPLCIMQKMEGRLAEKFDAAMAGCLSWTATLDARRRGVRPKPKRGIPVRIR